MTTRAVNLAARLANIGAARGKLVDFSRDCLCADDSDGLPARLAFWDAVKLGAEPTQAEVDAAATAPSAALLDLRGALVVDGTDRLQFEHLFDLENTTRDLKAKINLLAPGSYTAAESAQITRAQYRQALINRWKALQP